jgi:hypothetical protein
MDHERLSGLGIGDVVLSDRLFLLRLTVCCSTSLISAIARRHSQQTTPLLAAIASSVTGVTVLAHAAHVAYERRVPCKGLDS